MTVCIDDNIKDRKMLFFWLEIWLYYVPNKVTILVNSKNSYLLVMPIILGHFNILGNTRFANVGYASKNSVPFSLLVYLVFE